MTAPDGSATPPSMRDCAKPVPDAIAAIRNHCTQPRVKLKYFIPSPRKSTQDRSPDSRIHEAEHLPGDFLQWLSSSLSFASPRSQLRGSGGFAPRFPNNLLANY